MYDCDHCGDVSGSVVSHSSMLISGYGNPFDKNLFEPSDYVTR